jgi:hypothetical protein
MLKEKGKIILIIVLVIQLITPFTFLIYQNNFNKHLEEPDEYIKLNIDSICFEYENRFTIYFDESYSIEYDNYFYEYVYFEPSKNNEYSEIKFSENKPEINEYLEFYKFDNLMCYEVDDPYNIYEKHGYLNEFNEDLATSLVLITHDKSESYDIYVNKCCENIVSALVKFLDMIDNLNLFTLNKFEDQELERIIKYNNCLKIINDKFHFIEKFSNYNRMMKYLAYEKRKREEAKENK